MKYKWAISVVILSSAFLAGCATNQRLTQALQMGSLRVGMSKAELVSLVGYPPEGRTAPDIFFQSFVVSYTTSGGIEERWSYQLGSTPDLNYMRVLTITMENGIVTGWSEHNEL